MLLRVVGVVGLVLLGAGMASAEPPVAEAVKASDLEALRALVEQGVDVNAREPDGSTALHWAAYGGELEAVDLLLGAGARVTVATHYGVRPLSLAAEGGHAVIVERLIERGANPNASLTGGETVLMTAARTGRTGVVRALLEAGAEVNAYETTRRQTALMWAAAEGHADVVGLLIESGADIRAMSRGPTSPDDITNGDSAYLRVAPRVDVFTPLQFAVQAGQVDVVSLLLEAGADINDETPHGMGLLTLAIANAHFDVAAPLIEKGIDVNHARIGWAPLHQVVRVRTLNIGWGPPHPRPSGHLTGLDVAEMLLRHGADVDARTAKPWQDGYRGAFGLDATPLLVAAKGGDAHMMWLLAAHGADVTATNAIGTSVLMAAAGVEMMNPNEDSGRDSDGLAAVQVGMQLGAGDINARNARGDTALHGAIGRVSPASAEFLAKQGAQLDVQNDSGVMPIDVALNGAGIVGGRPATAEVLARMMRAQGLTVPESTKE